MSTWSIYCKATVSHYPVEIVCAPSKDKALEILKANAEEYREKGFKVEWHGNGDVCQFSAIDMRELVPVHRFFFIVPKD